MAISKFENEPAQKLAALHTFLNEHKTGTFLENVQLSLGSSTDGTPNGKLLFGSDLFIQCTGSSNQSNVVSYNGTYTSLTFPNNTDSNKHPFRFSSAILCTNGLILSGYDSTAEKEICRVIITVDDEGELAVILPSKSVYSFSEADTDYSLMTADSTLTTGINVAPAYSSNLTSLAPAAVKAMEASRTLPYAYAALTTQLISEGLEAVLIDGAPFITNGIWYIKDSD